MRTLLFPLGNINMSNIGYPDYANPVIKTGTFTAEEDGWLIISVNESATWSSGIVTINGTVFKLGDKGVSGTDYAHGGGGEFLIKKGDTIIIGGVSIIARWFSFRK